MLSFVGYRAALAAGAILCCAATPAMAQTRTYVSSNGSDGNTCFTPAQACRSLQRAVDQTVAGGEVDCLDPAGYGTVGITKSIAIICDNGRASIRAFGGGTAVFVNAGDGDVIYLSGFDLDGGGVAVSGFAFANGAMLHVRNSTVRGFRSAGIGIEPALVGKRSSVLLQDVVVTNSGVAALPQTSGIRIGVSNGGSMDVVIDRSRVAVNENVGLRIETPGSSTGAVRVVIRNSEFANDGVGVLVKAPVGYASAKVLISDSVMSQNSSYGLLANGANTEVYVTRSSIVFNGNGTAFLNGARTVDKGDNILRGNSADGNFSEIPPPVGVGPR